MKEIAQEETWEVNTAKPRRRKEGKGRSKGSTGKKNVGGTSFRGWAKPVETKANKIEDAGDTKSADKEPTGNGATESSSSGANEGFMMQPMSALLAEYGEFDPNWMDKQPEIVQDTQSVDGKSIEDKGRTNRLGQKGKAPLHIDIVSFGYRYGAPSTRKDGWSQTQPLLPFDCRDVLPQIPGYMHFHDGLSSGQVKRFLLYDYRRQAYRDRKDKSEDDSETQSEPGPSVRDYSMDTVAPKIFEALLEAVRTGGYGYALPLKMQIYIGSEWGRHRSVVAAEQTASAMRNLLRKCRDEEGLECPCSVATQHRDINRKLPSKKDRDEDE